MTQTKHLLIYGKVQNVGFRYWVNQKATAIGISGFIRNRLDGTVEAVISGDEEHVKGILHDCHQGPNAAEVDEIIVYDIEEDYPSTGFSISKTL